MKKHPFRQPLLVASASLLAVALAAGTPVQAGDGETAARQETEQAQGWAQMQERMETMQAQMRELRETTDPAERQKLLASHMRSMQEQMQTMRAMGGDMMMHGTGGSGGMGMGSGMGQGMGAADHAMPARPGPRHQMMENRMDMMQMMMEQMMGQMAMQMGHEAQGAKD